MKPGLLLKEAPEKLCVHRCYRCDSYYANSLEFQLHLEKDHNKAYAWYKENVKLHNGNYRNPEYIETIQITKGWCKADDPKIIMRAVFSKNYRPMRRMKVTPLEEANRKKSKTCHCGKKAGNNHYKYCSDECQADWYNKTDDIGHHKKKYLSKHKRCEKCNEKFQIDITYGHIYGQEMDHIIALIFGGHPWDHRNLQALCHKCHAKKTHQDIIMLKFWKDQQWYDPVFCRPDNGPGTQEILELYVKT